MSTTQEFLPITDIKNDLIFLADGSVTAVIKTSAVNFALLSEAEQVSIIESFAGFLNSLSFAIQIVIRSERLDVSSYLTLLDRAFQNQTNALMKNLIPHYRLFVERLIKENEVLDKQFYIAVNVSVPELGITARSVEDKTRKAITVLTPRLDHLSRQLGRIGLKAKRLNSNDLIHFFYNAYNTPGQVPVSTAPAVTAAPVQTPVPQPVAQPTPQPVVAIPRPIQSTPIQAPQPVAPRPMATAPQVTPYRRTPFVVEELADDYRT